MCVAGERLLDQGVERTGVAPLGHELRPGPLGDGLHREDRQRDRDQRHQGQEPRDHEHHAPACRPACSVEVSSWLSVCCMPWARLSMSLVTRLRRSPAGLAVDVAQRQAVELGLDALPQPVHRPLDDPGQHVGLDVAEDGRPDVERHHEPQHPVQRGEVDGRRPAVGEALEDHVGGPAEDLGADHRQAHAGQARTTTATKPKRSRRSMASSRLSDWRKLAVFSAGMPQGPEPPGRPSPAAAGAWAPSPRRRRRHLGPGRAHAASSWRCDSTISR